MEVTIYLTDNEIEKLFELVGYDDNDLEDNYDKEDTIEEAITTLIDIS